MLRKLRRTHSVPLDVAGLARQRRHDSPPTYPRTSSPVARGRAQRRRPAPAPAQLPPSGADAHYTRTAIVLHWLIAALVIAEFAWGWWMQEIPKQPGAARRRVQLAQVDRARDARADGCASAGACGTRRRRCHRCPYGRRGSRCHSLRHVRGAVSRCRLAATSDPPSAAIRSSSSAWRSRRGRRRSRRSRSRERRAPDGELGPRRGDAARGRRR